MKLCGNSIRWGPGLRPLDAALCCPREKRNFFAASFKGLSPSFLSLLFSSLPSRPHRAASCICSSRKVPLFSTSTRESSDFLSGLSVPVPEGAGSPPPSMPAYAVREKNGTFWEWFSPIQLYNMI